MDFKGVSTVLEKYGGQITDSIRQKLRQDNTYASGDAYNSVSYKLLGIMNLKSITVALSM